MLYYLLTMISKKLTRESNELEKDAIELGKSWMRKSIDPVHDFTHAQRVVQNSLKIYEELVESNPEMAAKLDPYLIELAGWWHDAYKSRAEKIKIVDIIKEGDKSALIVEEELNNYIKPERLERILKAIRAHPRVHKYFWRLNRIDPLLRVLLEADILDAVRKDRYLIGLKSSKNIFRKIFYFTTNKAILIFTKFFFKKSNYGKNVFQRNRSQKFLKVGVRSKDKKKNS